METRALPEDFCDSELAPGAPFANSGRRSRCTLSGTGGGWSLSRHYEAIAQFRKALPRVGVWFTSNGDYVHRKTLERLSDFGLSRIVICLHVDAGATYDDATQITRLSQVSARTGLPFKLDKFRSSQDFRARGRFGNLEITVKSSNNSEYGGNRADLLDHIKVPGSRDSPCDRPFHDLTSSWNGNVYPCCQFFDDYAGHQGFLVGNTGRAESLFALYCT